MNWNAIVDIIVALVLVVVTRYAVPYLQTLVNVKDRQKLVCFVTELVAAAEQIFRESGQGQTKKEYVVDALICSGYEVDHEIDALIEAAVFRLPSQK